MFRAFNCGKEICMSKLRTLESINRCLFQWGIHGHKKSLNNIHGVNSKRMLPVEPNKIIISELHCPMGLVDKWEEHIMEWIALNCMNVKEEHRWLREIVRAKMYMKSRYQQKLKEMKTHLRQRKTYIRELQEGEPLLDDMLERSRFEEIQSCKAEILDAEDRSKQEQSKYSEFLQKLREEKNSYFNMIK